MASMGTAQYYNNATNTSDDGGVSYYLKRAPCDVNVSTLSYLPSCIIKMQQIRLMMVAYLTTSKELHVM